MSTHADGDHIGCNAEFDSAHMHPAEMPYIQNTKADAAVSPLWEGDVIDIGGRSFEVLLIPGHTPGSIALLDRENRILVSGDSLSETPVFMFGEVRSIHAYIASMEKLIKLQGLIDEIYPSHGPFPIAPSQIKWAYEAAKKLAAGELPPQEPTFPFRQRCIQAAKLHSFISRNVELYVKFKGLHVVIKLDRTCSPL